MIGKMWYNNCIDEIQSIKTNQSEMDKRLILLEARLKK